MARLVHQFAIESPRVCADVIEANELVEQSQRYRVRNVPHVIVGNRLQFVGSVSEERLLQAVLRVVADETQQDKSEDTHALAP